MCVCMYMRTTFRDADTVQGNIILFNFITCTSYNFCRQTHRQAFSQLVPYMKDKALSHPTIPVVVLRLFLGKTWDM